jgi:hypothetical protein
MVNKRLVFVAIFDQKQNTEEIGIDVWLCPYDLRVVCR